MKDPAFLFYTSDFLTGIADLDMEERGQYISLLCLQHQKGHLTEKMIRLCVGNAAADVMHKFRKDAAGLWYNERLEKEIAKRAEHSEKQRQRALEGWEKRKKNNKEHTDATAHATALPLENEDVNENDIVIEEEVKEGLETIRGFTEESQQVFEALQEKFDITELGNIHVFKQLHSFVSVLQSKKQTEHFIQQAKAYWLYKEKSGDKTHGPQKFIGTIEKHYQDGGWCAENWVHKLNNFKENGTGKQTTIEKRDQSKRDTADAVMRHYAERLASEEGRGGV